MDCLKNSVAPAKTLKGGITGFIIGIVVAAVVLFSLSSTITTAISNAGLTGNNLAIANLTVTLLILMLIVAIATTLG